MDFAKLGEMMSAANDMKQKMDAQLASTIVEADSGGGAVLVRMNGRKQVQSVTITPAAAHAAAGDVTMLEDLILAALNAAWAKADAAAESSTKSMASSMLGGLNLPGL